MFTLAFWKAAAERAVKTFAQSFAGSLVVATGLTDAPWLPALSAAGLATLLSFVTSLASSGVGSDGPALGTETLTPKVAAQSAPKDGGYVAGPAANVPEGTPVDVEPAQEFDGMGAPISDDSRCPETRPGLGIAGARSRCNLEHGHAGPHSDERGYWGGI